jgi:N6-L-threonylcarbamoyladenine synthase
MGLVVSGGHTELILIEKIGKYQIIGETLDDAAGECFDKTARILGLGYPGGPAIAAEANKASPPPLSSPSKREKIKERVCLPRPMINSKDSNFSFSGLKTAVLYNFKSQTPAVQKSKKYKVAMAQEIQQAIIDVLIKKTFRTCQSYDIKNIILGGGVAANDALRHQFKIQNSKFKVDFLVPPKNLCMDNGAMVAMTGAFHLNQPTPWEKLIAQGNLKI